MAKSSDKLGTCSAEFNSIVIEFVALESSWTNAGATFLPDGFGVWVDLNLMQYFSSWAATRCFVQDIRIERYESTALLQTYVCQALATVERHRADSYYLRDDKNFAGDRPPAVLRERQRLLGIGFRPGAAFVAAAIIKPIAQTEVFAEAYPQFKNGSGSGARGTVSVDVPKGAAAKYVKFGASTMRKKAVAAKAFPTLTKTSPSGTPNNPRSASAKAEVAPKHVSKPPTLSPLSRDVVEQHRRQNQPPIRVRARKVPTAQKVNQDSRPSNGGKVVGVAALSAALVYAFTVFRIPEPPPHAVGAFPQLAPLPAPAEVLAVPIASPIVVIVSPTLSVAPERKRPKRAKKARPRMRARRRSVVPRVTAKAQPPKQITAIKVDLPNRKPPRVEKPPRVGRQPLRAAVPSPSAAPVETLEDELLVDPYPVAVPRRPPPTPFEEIDQ